MLSLDNNSIKNKGVDEIACALKELHTLKFLSLQNNNITEEAADNLGSIITSNNLIKVVQLGDNRLQDVSVISLVNAFKQTHYLDTLNFDHNHITEHGTDALVEIIVSNNKLRVLSLHNNYLKAAAATKLAKAVNHHGSIELLFMLSIYLSITDEIEIKQIIEQNTGLVNSHISFVKPSCHRDVTDYIPKHVIDISFGASPTTVNEIALLLTPSASHDRILCVSPTAHLASVDFKFLQSYHTLMLHKEKSSMLQIYVTDDVKDAINLSWSKPSQIEQLQYVMHTLFSNISTVMVDFNKNSQITISDIGFVTSLITHCGNLEFLRFGRLDAGLLTHAMIKEYRSTRKIAYLEMTATFYPQLSSQQLLNIVTSLRQVSTIKSINLSGNLFTFEIAQALAVALKNFTALNTLLLESCSLQNTMVQAITSGCHRAKLWTLDLSLNSITSKVLNNIALLINTNSSLYLDGNDMKALSNVNSSIALAGLAVLSIDSNIFQDVMYLYETASANGIQPCLELMIVCNHSFKVKAEIYLKSPLQGNNIKLNKCTYFLEPPDIYIPLRLHLLTLAVLMQMDSETTSVSWQHGNTLHETGMFNYLGSINNMETIQFSNMTNNSVTQVEADFISVVIKHNSKLKMICLSNHNFLMPLCEEFTVFQQQINSCNISSAKMKQILCSLESTVCLTVLNLSGNSIGEETAEILSNAITYCATLETVLLQSCSLQAKCMQIFGDSLAQIKTLRILNLSDNKLTDEAAESIISIINGITVLKELHLDNNMLSHQTLNRIGIGSKFTSLSFLVIDAVMVTKNAVKCLENSAVNGSKINCLTLKNHTLKLAGLIYLRKCMSCFSLVLLKASCCEASPVITDVKDGHIKVNWNSHDKLAATGMLNLISAFTHVTNLQCYNLTNRYISEQDVDTIATLVANFSRLEQVTFHCMSSEAMLSVLNSLKNCTVLKVLNVYCSNFTVVVSRSLALFLNGRKEISHLSLFSCLLVASDITHILSSLNYTVTVYEI